MTHAQTPRRSRRSKRRRLGDQTSSAPGLGAGSGTPRFMKAPKPEAADHSSGAEHEARRVGAEGGEVREAPQATPMGRAAAAAASAHRGQGAPLGASTRERAEARLASDFGAVRVHRNSFLAAGFGANALTYGGDIHFAPGAYEPGTAEGEALIGHELAHVVQQGRSGTDAAQFDLTPTGLDTGLGEFDMAMLLETNAASMTGLKGTITFTPHETSPYSNRIGLIQTVDVNRVTDSGAEEDFTWGGAEANRESVKTPDGEFVDMLHAKQGPERESEPWYWEGMSGDPEDATRLNHFGWNRGDGDLHDTQLYDWPTSSGHLIFNFETVAVGRDSETVYGALNWGFEVTGSNLIENEWYDASQILASGTGERHQSAEFEAARENFREFYIHEPEVIYFDTEADTPQAGELDKMSDAASYLAAHPDVDIELTGSADTRGAAGYNRRLALRRIASVEAHLLALGIDPARIHRNETTAGESSAQGAQDAGAGAAGSLQSNRRVEVRYQRMMSLP